MSIVPICPEKLLLQPDNVISQFMIFKKATGVSKRTIQDYQKTLRLFFSRYPDALDYPRERTLAFLSAYENPSSYNIRYAYLKVFWDWVMREGYFKGGRHPLDGLKKRKPRGRIVQLEANEISKLLQQPNRERYAGLRDYALLCLSIDTGIRPGEALQLMPEDCNSEKAEMIVRAEISKTRIPRVLPLSAPTIGAIQKLLTVRPLAWTGSPIFANETGTQLQVMTWSRRVTAYGKRCGLNITAYHLRHAAALMLLRKGADAFTVQNMLGHSTMQMTRHYVNLTSEDTRRGHAKAGVLVSLLGDDAPKNPRTRRL